MIPTRTDPDLTQEKFLWKKGYCHVGGIDEAGRGSWAGPVFAAVVILSSKTSYTKFLGKVRDSKQMTPRQRQIWAERITKVCLDWGVGYASNEEIDKLGIVPATHLAARRAMQKLKNAPDYLLLDYLKIDDIPISQRAFIRGDQQVLSIAAASIIAKTCRDRYMGEMDSIYPAYLFINNKGYGTAAHRKALQQHGICPIHRLSFKPIIAIKNAP